MNGIFKTAATIVTSMSIVTASAAPLLAHERWNHHKHPRHNQPIVVEKNDAGELIAAGIIGLAIGAIIVGAASKGDDNDYVHRPVRPRPDRDYFPPSPDEINDEPHVIYAEPAYEVPQPWSPEWYRYCRNRFRSFDENSGTYLGYDGKRHFCVAK